uniref:Uncharacterized LOC114460123 n=1 Tax=Gouania willdenowi TaxID=441366 RepID=A0A8C5EM45_GOUWI
NMDTELFMECEEEELEPWQQVNDGVDEDDMDYMENGTHMDTHRLTDTHGHTETHGHTLMFLCFCRFLVSAPCCRDSSHCSNREGRSSSVVMSCDHVHTVTPVVMSVEEFYYGCSEGLKKPRPLGTKPTGFICHLCSQLADNNLSLMQHMLLHSDFSPKGGGPKDSDVKTFCRFCYRRFSSSIQLQTHLYHVHGSAHCTTVCRMCEWAFDSQPSFLGHMKSHHKPGEMPYVCQVCSFRSSFYSDVIKHFSNFHKDTHFLMCVFCLRITKNLLNYTHHLLRHQASHCNRCRLQFVCLKDKMQHKQENHQSFRRPAQLEGLPPGSKVTIRTYGKVRAAGSPASHIKPLSIKTEPVSPEPKRRCHRNRATPLLCLECRTDASDLTAHYPTLVRCLLCSYSSCCSRAYASHMIQESTPAAPSPRPALPCPPTFGPLARYGDLGTSCRGAVAPCWSLTGWTPRRCAACPPTPQRVRRTRCGGALPARWGCCRPSPALWPSVEVASLEEPVDPMMAPVEDLDFSDDDEDFDKEDLIEDGEHTASLTDEQTEADDWLGGRQLKMALFALCEGVSSASRFFSCDPATVRSVLSEARRNCNRAGLEGEEQMVLWVLSMWEQQLPITESALFHQASALKRNSSFDSAFRISYAWAVDFLLRYRLSPAPALSRELLPVLEEKVVSFKAFVQKIVRVHGLSLSVVAAVDELCVFVDWDLVQNSARRCDALRLTGTKPLLCVFLAVLANGTRLPALVVVKKQLEKRALPESVLLEVVSEDAQDEDALDIWMRRVWAPHVAAQNQPCKSLLILDQHREHTAEPFLSRLSEFSTLPALIPTGSSSHLQPLDVCVRPVLQNLLTNRWSSFSSSEGPDHQDQSQLAGLLVDWIVQALEDLDNIPDVWRSSFSLTGLLREQGEDTNLAERRTKLLRSLTELTCFRIK